MPNMDKIVKEAETAENNLLNDKKYEDSYRVKKLIEANRLLIEEREQDKAEIKRWESAADFWNDKVAEQDKEIQQHIKGIKLIQDVAIDMSFLPQQALNAIHGTATQLLLKIKI